MTYREIVRVSPDPEPHIIMGNKLYEISNAVRKRKEEQDRIEEQRKRATSPIHDIVYELCSVFITETVFPRALCEAELGLEKSSEIKIPRKIFYYLRYCAFKYKYSYTTIKNYFFEELERQSKAHFWHVFIGKYFPFIQVYWDYKKY